MSQHLPHPLSTYRLQFNHYFTFQMAQQLVDYLHQLGISHLYSSPLFCAKSGSRHGYDIISHQELNADVGTREQFETLIKQLRVHNMGFLFDLVPNHIYIGDCTNQWWRDVLENGPSSFCADYFDIDWDPPKHELQNKILLPLLEQNYGDAIENQQITISYKEGTFLVLINTINLPTDPKTWNLILEPLLSALEDIYSETDPHLLELKSILTALGHLPMGTQLGKEQIIERQREKEVIKRRVEQLFKGCEDMLVHLNEQLNLLNGIKGNPHSFDNMEAFLNAQCYRLCYWRVANEEVNYRRFFDVPDLAGIRTEKQEVFESIHALVFDLYQHKLIDGLRIDHVDGLWEPELYLKNVQSYLQHSSNAVDESKRNHYVIVEKILTGNEKIRAEWPVEGTVGYDYLNLVNGLFVFQDNKKKIIDLYRRFTEVYTFPFELVYTCKTLILTLSLSSELHVLSRKLEKISQQHRKYRDFTSESLKGALRDVIACFPVYRSYINSTVIHEEDKQSILTAVSRAKRLNPAINASLFDFIQEVLLLEHPPGITEEQIQERQNFIMHLQQLTGPVMAKGVEDTAFYRYFPLLSLNEVGNASFTFGTSIETIHKKNIERLKQFPHTLIATSTHDTKLSEDVRARINVLSEIPDQWEEAIKKWSQQNAPHKSQEGENAIPDANEEYLFYQILLGSWPLDPMDSSAHAAYTKRLEAYMEKALREAKIHTSWVNPNQQYDEITKQFVQKTLTLQQNPFLENFTAFIPKIVAAGMLNSLSQLILKLFSPGIPDIYQGNEIWDFSLVDPDNRREVDFSKRKDLLKSILEIKDDQKLEKLLQFLNEPADGRIKLYITKTMLQIRQRYGDVFTKGTYHPLTIHGDNQNHLIAFAWQFDKKVFIAITTRFLIPLMQNSSLIIPSKTWNNHFVSLTEELGSHPFQDVLSGKSCTPQKNNGEYKLNLEEILSPAPFAILEK